MRTAFKELGTLFGWLGAVVFVTLGLRAIAAVIPLGAIDWPDGVPNDRTVPTQGDYRTESVPNEPWLLVIGGSSIYYGVYIDRLGVPARKMAFNRGYSTDVSLALAWTLRALPPERRPKYIVWGLNLPSLINRQEQRPHPCVTPVAQSRPDPVLAARMGLCDDAAKYLGFEDRVTAAVAGLDLWYAARPAFQDWLVQRLQWPLDGGALDEVPTEWFDPSYDIPNPEHVKKWIEEVAKPAGVFGEDPIYAPHVKAVAEGVKVAKQYGIPISLISMPEASILRNGYSATGKAKFQALLSEPGVPILDLSDKVPDPEFRDHGHLTSVGRARTSVLVAEYLKTVF